MPIRTPSPRPPRHAGRLALAALALLLALLGTTTRAAATAPGAQTSAPELRGDPAQITELLGHPFEFANLDQARGAAMEATRLGEIQRARDILGDLLVLDFHRQSSALLAANDPASALPLIKQCLAIAPRSVGLLRQRAQALLALAEQAGRDGRSGLFVQSAFEDALRAFDECPTDAASLFGQSKAQWWLNRSQPALELASRAAELLRGQQAPIAGLPPALTERYPFGGAQELLAQAAYLVFADAARLEIDAAPESNAERSDQAYAKALAECDAAAAVDPELAASWIRLCNLELYRGAARQDLTRTEAALAALQRGLELVPDEAELLAKLIAVSGQQGGAARTLQELERLALRAPSATRTSFELSKARFLLAQTTQPADGANGQANEAARRLFMQARDGFAALAEDSTNELAASAQGWMVIAQAGLGWVSFNEGDNGRAESEFKATEAMLPGGLRWKWDGVMRSAEEGLALLVSRYAQSEDLERAGELSAQLAELAPDNADYPNNAGFFWRDAAVAAELWAARLCAAARGVAWSDQPGQPLSGEALAKHLSELRERSGVAPELHDTEAEKRLFRTASERELALARKLIDQSANQYKRAAELAPEDVRLINDAALVLVHYTHTNLDAAEALLERATQLGGAQLSAGNLDQDRRYNLTEAWGDAFYNLGILYLDHRGQPERARFYFERSLEIGPPDVARMAGTREYFLKRCSGELPADPQATVLAWGQPCP